MALSPISPATRLAYRAILDEILQEEIALLRLRHRVALLKAGCHPQQQLVEAVLGFGFALHDTYGNAE